MASGLRVLSERNFVVWIIGAFVSNTGHWLFTSTLAWLILTEYDASAAGVSLALQFGPSALLMTVSGRIADTFDRKHTLLICQGAFALVASASGLAVMLGYTELWVMLSASGAFGLVSAFEYPNRHAFVAELVSRAQLPGAVGLNTAVYNLTRMGGPALAGVLTAAVGGGWALLAAAFTYLWMAGAITSVTRVAGRPLRSAAGSRFRPVLRLAANHVELLATGLIVFVISGFGMNYPIFVAAMTTLLGSDVRGYGVLLGMLAAGAFVGAMVSAHRSRGNVRSVIGPGIGFGVATAAGAFAPNGLVYGLLLCVIGFLASTMLTSASASIQLASPPGLRGRMMAAYMAVLMGSAIIGSPTMGVITAELGPRVALAIAGTSSVVAALAGLAMIYRAHVRRAETSSAADGIAEIDR